MNHKEFIKELQEIKDNYEYTRNFGNGFNTRMSMVIGEADKLKILEQPVIPAYVADWIQKAKEQEYSISYALDCAPRELHSWFESFDLAFDNNHKQQIFIQAWLNGYKIEQVKLYYIKFSENQYAQRFDGSQIDSILINDKELAGKFSKEEIKQMNPNLMALAVEVI